MRLKLNQALVTVLIFSLAQANKNDTAAKKSDKSETKISASLIVDNKTISLTEKSIETSKNSSVITRENARELTIEPDTDADPILSEDSIDHEETPEALPEALELRHSRIGTRRPLRGPLYRPPMRRPPNSNRRNVFPEPLRGPSKRPVRRPETNKREPTTHDCTFFGKTVCLKTLNYPQEAILRSIRGNRDMVDHLLKDYNIQREDRNDDVEADVFPLETRYERYESNEIRRRSDYPLAIDNNVEEGFTCPSQVMYARPQLARAASGVWKYIINTGDHTQTLRLEKCSKPKSSCSFISDNYRSSCIQVYNYHRLLTWDNDIGLHIDIFKIPSCCSCHVHGYAELYPPLQKDPSLSGEENFPGAEFSTDHSKGLERPSSYLSKLPSVYDSGSKPLDASSSNHPSFILPRPRPKKPSSPPRPFDKLPQQHAPNTRAPGYKGPMKVSKRPTRPNRPFRRESTDVDESSSTVNANSNSNINSWFEQAFDQGTDPQRPNGEFEDDYEEPGRRVNYNYHPILEFFEPKASMLKSEPTTQKSSIELTGNPDANSWKPMIAI